VTRGVPAGAATAVLWIVKLAVLGMLLYTVSWLVLLLAFAVVAAWLARNADEDDEKQPELRDGHSGVGLYDKMTGGSTWAIPTSRSCRINARGALTSQHLSIQPSSQGESHYPQPTSHRTCQ
jgi:hypothetical protein